MRTTSSRLDTTLDLTRSGPSLPSGVLLGDTPGREPTCREASRQARREESAVANPLDQVTSWPATAAVGVASAAGLMESTGPGGQPVAWAALTKLLVALPPLDAVQRGLLDLGEPAGPPGSTIRHLLAHASGLAFDSDMILGKPGTRRIYSNRGIEIVADIVAARSGRPFERVLADEICLPLGMAGTRLEGSPAWGAVGPLSDLMNLAVELAGPSLIDEDLLAQAT